MPKFKCVLFDLDGTLIDTTPLIMSSFRHTFRHHFNCEKEDAELVRFLGIPLSKAFGETCPGMEEEMICTYREFNERVHDTYVGVFLSVTDALRELKEKGVLLGVVTSKRRAIALRGMKLFGLDEFMNVFVSCEDTKRHKPEGDPVVKALEILGIEDKSSVLYVGDSPYDILCARNAGVSSAAVDWSFLEREELSKYEPDFFLDSPLDLLKLV